MAEPPRVLSYTDTEIRSYLPSGWGLPPGAAPRWEAAEGVWSIEVYDGADHTWTVAVAAAEAEKAGRFAALKQAIDRLGRKALGRKSVISG